MDSGFENRNKRVCTRTHLPDESLSLIFEKLERKDLSLIFEKLKRKDDRDSFGLACHKFLDIQNLSRRELAPSCNIIVSYHAVDSFIHKMLNRFRYLESLSLNRCRGLSDSGLTPLQMYGSKLQSLDLFLCSRLTDNGVSYVASGCPLLSSVCLYICCFTDYGLQILTESCKSLKHVDISWCSEITDNGIQCLNQNCRQLTKLWISGCDKILGKGFQGVSPTLAFLEAENCQVDSKGVSAIVSGGGLEYLNLSSRHKDPRECDISAIGLGFCAHMKTLDLKNCNFVEDATITKIAKGCPLLQEWNLSGCYKITDLDWWSIGSYCQNLNILHVNRCKTLRSIGLKALREGCAQLSVIYLAHCPQIYGYDIDMFNYLRQDVKIIKQDESMKIITPNWHSVEAG